MKERYSRNLNALSPGDVEALHTKRVCVVGCGGLGGHIVETMARIGVLYITVVDCDVFEESNLNRQLFSTESVIGVPKVEAAKRRIADVNKDVYVNALCDRFDERNAAGVVAGHDVVMDALDNVSDRLMLSDVCSRLGIPLVHGSIGGWYGQVAAVLPGDRTLHTLYANAAEKGVESGLGNMPFTAATVAALQCAEAVKIMTHKGELLRNALIRLDMLNNDYCVIRLEPAV